MRPKNAGHIYELPDIINNYIVIAVEKGRASGLFAGLERAFRPVGRRIRAQGLEERRRRLPWMWGRRQRKSRPVWSGLHYLVSEEGFEPSENLAGILRQIAYAGFATPI